MADQEQVKLEDVKKLQRLTHQQQTRITTLSKKLDEHTRTIASLQAQISELRTSLSRLR